MINNIFELPINVYLRALSRIERYSRLKNQIGRDSILWDTSFMHVREQRNQSIEFLMKEQLMTAEGCLTNTFSTQNRNALIADAAHYAQSLFNE